MTRVLLVFEHDDRGRLPDAVSAAAAAAEGAGAELRLRALEASGARDIAWADAMALGIDGRGAALPAQTKCWLDGLGFGGWRHLRDKPGCVFATRARGGDSAAACRMVARILRSRGMDTVTPVELDVPGTVSGDDGGRVGAAFMRWCRRLDGSAAAHDRKVG